MRKHSTVFGMAIYFLVVAGVYTLCTINGSLRRMCHGYHQCDNDSHRRILVSPCSRLEPTDAGTMYCQPRMDQSNRLDQPAGPRIVDGRGLGHTPSHHRSSRGPRECISRSLALPIGAHIKAISESSLLQQRNGAEEVSPHLQRPKSHDATLRGLVPAGTGDRCNRGVLVGVDLWCF